ncbi:catalase [Methylophilus rhizosphaerae]|uniref:Catalase-related peroxidase n=1 Tax=Methylophilus rhizosphaerae TaxID=492660 RepID=A0A1G9ECJ3_9PROT|nr:catalase family peroxidase [Methylophilus rhizosphaerae]SDK73824.1 catalase [Methylophilus rhizosphaerae]
MKIKTLISLLFAASLITALPVLADEKPVTEQLVDTLTTLAGGPHAGFRANHAKGIMLEGSFTPSAQAASISKAAHLQKADSPVLVRFSDATGVPNIPDASGNAFPKGIAIRFQLADGTATDIVSISVNGFPAATPEDFLGLLNAVRDSQGSTAKPSPVEQFLGSHPAALKFVTTPKPAPVSFATQPFFGVNAFKFTNAAGQSEYGRYQIIPVAGAQYLSKEAADAAAPDYLMNEIAERVKTQGVQYKILLQIADKGDEVNNATVVWPDSRKTVELGTLTLKSVVADSKAREKTLMFNPLQLTEGIEPSQDPILLARPTAYAVSYGRRLNQ